MISIAIVIRAFRACSVIQTDYGNHAIRRIDMSTAAVTTFAGGSSGFIDGTGTSARFKNPTGIASGPGASFYLIGDYGNDAVRRLSPSTGVVTTLAGGASGSSNGVGTSASFNGPVGIALNSSGTYALIADSSNNMLRALNTETASVTTLAGQLTAGSTNGVGTAAKFDFLLGVTMDGAATFAVVVSPLALHYEHVCGVEAAIQPSDALLRVCTFEIRALLHRVSLLHLMYVC